MLQTIRKYTHGWVATIMGIILSLAFVMWGIENYLSGSGKKNVVAKVNGKEITTAELNTDFQHLTARVKEQLGSMVLGTQLQEQLKKEALSNLVTRAVLTQAALHSGFDISSYQISAVIRQMPEFKMNGQFSRDRLSQVLTHMGYTLDQFVSDAKQSMLLNQVASGILGTAFTLPNEANQAAVLLDQRRDVVYAIIPTSKFKNINRISLNQITNYYQQHQNLFKEPAKLSIEYLQLSVDDLKKTIKVSDQDLNEYFNANSDLQKNNSKAQARAAVIQQKVEQSFLTASDKLTDLTFTHPNSLIDAANALGLKIQTSEFFTQKGGNTSITKNPKVIATAFSADILKSGNNSNLIEIAPGVVVVLRIKEYKPEGVLPLDQVKDQIKTLLAQEDSRIKTKQEGETILSHLKDQKDFYQLLIAQHLSVVEKNKIFRHENDINQQILQFVFSLPIAHVAKGIALNNGDYALVMVKNIYTLPLTQVTEQQRRKLGKLMSSSYGNMEYDLYTQNQMIKAKIKILDKHI